MVQLPTYKQVSGWSYLKWILVAIAIGLIAYLGYAYLNHIEPGYTWVTGLFASVQNFNLGKSLTDTWTWVTQNTALVGAAVSAGLFLYGLLRERAKKIQIEAQAQQLETQASNQITTLYEDNKKLAAQLETLQSNASNNAYSTYEATIQTLTGQKSQLENTVSAQSKQIQELLDKLTSIPVRVVEVVK